MSELNSSSPPIDITLSWATAKMERTASSTLKKPVDSFRASCDNCAKSKVRCSKEQPSCQRCLYQGVSCTYSPSQRRRKQRLSWAYKDQQIQGIPSPRVTTVAPIAAPLPATARVPSPAVSRVLGPPAMVSSIPEYDMVDIEGPQNENDGLSFLDILETDYEACLGLGNVTGPSQSPRPSQQDRSPSLQPIPIGEWFPSSLLQLHDLEEQDMLSLSPLGDNDKPKPLLGRSKERAKSNRQGHIDCTHLARTTLQSLNRPAESCTRAGSGSQLMSPRSLDNILSMNQDAINNLVTIFNCECETTTDMVLQLTQIVLRILWWYQICLDQAASDRENEMGSSPPNNSNNASSPPLSLFSHSSSSSVSSSKKTGDSTSSSVQLVSISPINIGNYRLDAEHSDRIVKELTLMKLMQLKDILATFSQRSCCDENSISSLYSSSKTTVSESSSRNQLHLVLCAYLRNQLKTTILRARQYREGSGG